MLLFQLHPSCSLSCCDVDYNVFITLVHTHTQCFFFTCYERVVVVQNGRSVTKIHFKQ
jgi:hypothetical protein